MTLKEFRAAHRGGVVLDTFFAPAPRVSPEDLSEEIRTVSENPVMTGLLSTVSGLLAVLDSHRQIVALNDSFMRMIGIEDLSGVLGLRPGEALDCVHAGDEPAGCGTTEFCSTCGAAIAIVTSLGENRPVQRLCALSANRDGREVELAFSVRSQPVTVGGRKFVLLFLADVTRQQKYAALERVFFHDVNNLVGMLLMASDNLHKRSGTRTAEIVRNASEMLAGEVAVQRLLHDSDSPGYQPIWHEIMAGEMIDEIRTFFGSHPSATGKSIAYPEEVPDVSITTDLSLLFRVLVNMTINALEATAEGGSIRVWVESENGSCRFRVWNQGKIPEDVQRRIFQRNFSTKEQPGRGVGTYSMKLLGEELLGGRVSFTSSGEEGTVFSFSCPLARKVSGQDGP